MRSRVLGHKPRHLERALKQCPPFQQYLGKNSYQKRNWKHVPRTADHSSFSIKTPLLSNTLSQITLIFHQGMKQSSILKLLWQQAQGTIVGAIPDGKWVQVSKGTINRLYHDQCHFCVWEVKVTKWLLWANRKIVYIVKGKIFEPYHTTLHSCFLENLELKKERRQKGSCQDSMTGSLPSCGF